MPNAARCSRAGRPARCSGGGARFGQRDRDREGGPARAPRRLGPRTLSAGLPDIQDRAQPLVLPRGAGAALDRVAQALDGGVVAHLEPLQAAVDLQGAVQRLAALLADGVVPDVERLEAPIHRALSSLVGRVYHQIKQA